MEEEREEWRVALCNDELLVSDRGQVVLRYRAKRPVQESITKKGFRVVHIGTDKKIAQRRPLHQVVLETFVGFKPKGSFVRFKNGNKTDCLLSNLEYTPSKLL